jgi:FAD:protein FMN transferase
MWAEGVTMSGGVAMNVAGTLVKRVELMMGTEAQVYVSVPAEIEPAAHAAIDACMLWLHEVDRRLTRFDRTSELCQLNAAAGHWVVVSPLTFGAISEAISAAHITGGLFDPTLLPILEDLGYDRDFSLFQFRESGGARASSETCLLTRPLGAWREIEMDARASRVRLPPDARLDLGGIAKGWAVDVALERFFEGFPNVIVDIGGDMAVRGGIDEGGGCWPLGIGDPRTTTPDGAEQTAAVLTLGRGGLATSGASLRWWTRRGQRVHHLIDPRTGFPIRLWIDAKDDADLDPAPPIATASALAATAAHAEVAAKVALLRGYPEALRAVETAWPDAAVGVPAYGDAGVALLLTRGTGEVACSSNITEYLEALGGGGNVWLD